MRDIGNQAGYYTGLGAVISRLPGGINTCVSGATGVYSCFTIYEKMKLSSEDPEEFKKRYPREVEDK